MNFLNKKNIISLSDEELLIFFESISKINEIELNNLDLAEKKILWDLESVLEKELTEPFIENYSSILEKAKEEFLDGYEE